MTTSRYLADIISNITTDSFSTGKTWDRVKECIIDLLGCAAAGQQADSVRTILSTSKDVFATGSSHLWFSDGKLVPSGAAMVNSAASSAFDLDDGHRDAGGHPGASVIPATIAMAEEAGSSGREILTAIVIGYEVGVKVASSRNFDTLITLSTGRWCAFGVAAACSWLKRLPPDRIAQAISIAGVLSPDLSAAGYSRYMGNAVKEGIPWATFTGMVAVELAERGFSGPLDIFDNPRFFDSTKIRTAFKGSPVIENVYFKPYGCCRWIHSALDALSCLVKEQELKPDEVDSIKVYTFSRALTLNNYPNPPTLESAQYSVPFCLATFLVKGENAFLPMRQELLKNDRIISLATKVELYEHKEFTRMFPKYVPSKVVVSTVNGRCFEKTVIVPKGDPGNRLSFNELKNKMGYLMGPFLSDKRQKALLNTISSIEFHKTPDALINFFNRRTEC